MEYGIGGNTVTYTAAETAEVAPTIASSATFDETAVTATSSFDIYLNGGSGSISVAGAYADNAAFVADVGSYKYARLCC